jgi:hypothetical protein
MASTLKCKECNGFQNVNCLCFVQRQNLRYQVDKECYGRCVPSRDTPTVSTDMRRLGKLAPVMEVLC